MSTGRLALGTDSKAAGLSKFLGVTRSLAVDPPDRSPASVGGLSSFREVSSWAVAASKRIFSASFPLATTVRIMELARLEFERCLLS